MKHICRSSKYHTSFEAMNSATSISESTSLCMLHIVLRRLLPSNYQNKTPPSSQSYQVRFGLGDIRDDMCPECGRCSHKVTNIMKYSTAQRWRDNINGTDNLRDSSIGAIAFIQLTGVLARQNQGVATITLLRYTIKILITCFLVSSTCTILCSSTIFHNLNTLAPLTLTTFLPIFLSSVPSITTHFSPYNFAFLNSPLFSHP